ncbi:MAG TPA: YetF domain-containing protein [Afifellaceae bacterium]|nr:YetF domain-containing protein [Afifellaceae bacterium]
MDLQDLARALHDLIGSDDGPITWWQMALRAIVIFVFGILLVRLAGKRAFGKASAFDIVFAIVIGSNLSRTLTASAPFLPTLAASAALVLMHRALAWAAYHTNWLGNLIKGKPRCLIENGETQERELRASQITEHDLEEALRLNAGQESLAGIEAAYLERNGDISFLRRRDQAG